MEECINPNFDIHLEDASVFLLMTFGYSWMIWFLLLFITKTFNNIPFLVKIIIALMGAFGPTIAAIYQIYKSQNSVTAFILSAFDILSLPIYLTAMIYIAPILFVIISSLFIQNKIKINYNRFLWYVPYSLLMILSGPIQEEFGWRGYLLNIILLQYSSFTSSIILGIIWSVWHYPLFLIKGSPQYNMKFSYFMIMVTGLSLFMTFVHNKSENNLTASILLHASANSFSILFGQEKDPKISNRNLLYYGIIQMTFFCLVFFVCTV
eukprot:520168_1